ncbi:unnamed protein product [Arabidopsis lyrata]|uniref:Uncharacterized protein n=1 Tax=Arabidopsis lyrata subsp. lyrata TaxID=81972 RepID=D7M9E0_ARALL|nr:hypothetical protein ARALYDRAFT_354856 [Arabidopsis lyrata subsp. lyrata]CAH8276116.1 unnamed protein product [Arabidopsis lyrata]
MADQVRNAIYTVLARFQVNLIDNLRFHVNEMVDVDQLVAIRVLLENIMNALDANELLHPVADPVDPVADPAGPEAQAPAGPEAPAPAPAPDEIVINDHDVPPGSNSDED